MKTPLTATIALATVFVASGAEWYVDPVNGLDTRDGTTSNVVSATVGPRKTLEKAMELVNADDTLWLLPGEYNEGSMNSGRTRIYIAKSNVKVMSTDGAANTFIVGAGGGNIRDTSAMQCARVDKRGVIFKGITFKDGCAQNLGDGVVKDNGGGIGDYSEGYTWAVDCVFTNCWANMGGGMYFGNALRCKFVDCYAFNQNTGCAVSRGKNFAFCLFQNCSTNYAATFYPYSNGNKFYNCTFYGQTGNAFFQNDTKHSVLNSIIVGYVKNGSAGMYATNSVMGTASCADMLNCVTDASVAKSGLVSPSEGDFRVTEASAAASIGDASLLADFPAPTGYSLDRDLDGKLVPLSGSMPAGCFVEVGPCHQYYVDCVNGDDGNDGSKGHPYKTIRAATTNALSGDVIHVAPGTYGEAEGSQTATSKVEARVVVPVDVTLESTAGAEKTFIVGAAAIGDQIDNATYGTGTNAIRCVYAMKGAVVRGFTLTGGRGVGSGTDDGNGRGAAFYSEKALGATVEDCIISNNASYTALILQAVVKRCRVIGNFGLSSAAGGQKCSYYNAIVDGNKGNATMQYPEHIENCTIGKDNRQFNNIGPQVILYNATTDKSILNTVILGTDMRLSISGSGKLYCTNCLIESTSSDWTGLPAEQLHNVIFTNAAAINMTDCKPNPESVAIDAGDASVSSTEIGDNDAYGSPRVQNGVIDIGAVEYDWRPTFNAELGRRFTVIYASPTVTTNASGGVKLDGDVGALGDRALPVCVGGTATSDGPYEFRFVMTGGSVQVYVGDVLADEASGTGEQSIRFNVANTADEIRFVYTPDAENPDALILHKFSGARGFSMTLR